MTPGPQPKHVAHAAAAAAVPPVVVRRRVPKGDVHIGTMAGDVRRVPGSGTANGQKAIADVMRDVLDRVRRSIRERSVSASRRR